jgi:DNA modification methylase
MSTVITEQTKRIKYRDKSFDYADVDTSWGVHGIHPYPAMMIYPIARRLLLEYSKPGDTILDPFMGSGTVLVESLLHERNAYGIDINPLALLLAKAKITPVKTNELLNVLQELLYNSKKIPPKYPRFFNLDFWFKHEVINALAKLLARIENIENTKIKNFFKAVFSETVRRVSNTRNGEFKLLRMKELSDYNPDTFGTLRKIALENIEKLSQTYKTKPKTWVKLLEKDTRNNIPIKPESINLILTSPPYGDSRTTVAYGQFSRLSLQWLGYEKVNIDRESLGGIPVDLIKNDLPSQSLQRVIDTIAEREEKRAREVLSFYYDLYKCFINLEKLLVKKGYFCIVIGNRRVKQVTIPTDEIISELCEGLGFVHSKTIIREIPNKRMPRVNSPTNIAGEVEETMNNEYIVILKKER